MRMIDLSRELYHRTPTYPGQPPIIHGIWKTHEESFVESGNVHGNCVMLFSMPDHGGTHIDAPRHFGMSGIPIDEYPLENCYVNMKTSFSIQAFKKPVSANLTPLHVGVISVDRRAGYRRARKPEHHYSFLDARRAASPVASLKRWRGMLSIANRRRPSACVSKSAST